MLHISLSADVSKVGFKALSALKHLRHLVFGERMENWELEQKCVMLCTENLPRLHVAGRRFDFSWISGNAQKLFSYHNQVMTLYGSFGLKEVVLSGRVRPIWRCSLPEVRSMHWHEPSGDVLSFLLRFTTLTELGLYETKVDTIMLVLKRMGRRLRRLTLIRAHQKLQLAEVIKLCPNLEMLRIQCCWIDDCSIDWPEDCFNCLKEFYLRQHWRVLPSGFIFKVRPPKLFSLKMWHNFELGLF